MNPPSPEIQDWVAAYLAGQSSAQEAARLSAVICADPEARDYYLAAAHVHAELMVEESLWMTATVPAASRVPQRQTFPLRWLRFPARLAAVLAVLVLAGVGLHLWRTAGGGQSSVAMMPAVAVLSHGVNPVWEGVSGPLQEGAELRAGRLTLAGGIAQVDFYAGARLVMVGPAELEIRSARDAFLTRGQATCEVNAQGRGFRLSAPGLEVVDLGTVFGMRVLKDGGVEVHVLEGRVAATPSGAGQAVELAAGQARRVEHGTLHSIRHAPGAFPRSGELRRREHAAATRKLAAWREAAQSWSRDPAVLVHFTFDPAEPQAGGVVRNNAQGLARGSDGMVIGAQRAEGRWAGKGALEFRGRGDRVLLQVPGQHLSLTCAAWVRVDAYLQPVTALLVTEAAHRWQGVAGGRSPAVREELPHLPLRWELRNDGQLALNWQRAAPAAGSAWQIHWAETGLTPDRLGGWVLLATVVDASRREVLHYVNGRERARRPVSGAPPFALTRLCLGNLSVTDAEAGAGIRYGFFGRMDEVLIAGRALSAVEIARCYDAGKP